MNFKCRNCMNPLTEIIDFGLMPISNAFKSDKKVNEYRFRMRLMFCEKCSLVQLAEQPDPEIMFNDSYPFFTGKSKFMIEHFKKVADEILLNYLNCEESNVIVEIGCNDGTFLTNFKNKGIEIIGFEPSKSVANRAEENGIRIIPDFFDIQSAKYLKENNSRANVIYASNVICHIAEINNLAKAVSESLVDDGYFIFEEPYLGDVLKLNSFDQIYDEHVFLFSLKSVENIFAKCGLKLFHAEHLNTHGGSMRYYLSKNLNISASDNYILLVKKEMEFKVNNLSSLNQFSENCKKFQKDFIEFLNTSIRINNKTLVGYPATSKSTTIINFVGSKSPDFQYIYDSTEEKIGGVAPGSGIPIIDEKLIADSTPDYCFLFGWNHHRELLAKLEKDPISFKAKWVTHIPNFKIYENFNLLSKQLNELIND